MRFLTRWFFRGIAGALVALLARGLLMVAAAPYQPGAEGVWFPLLMGLGAAGGDRVARLIAAAYKGGTE